jgi:hypothetical protein
LIGFKSSEAHGIEYLHLVDLDGAKSSRIVNYKVLEQIASKTNLKIDFGGGLKSDADLKIAFESGANQITGGSIAIKQPEVFKSWIQQYDGMAERDKLLPVPCYANCKNGIKAIAKKCGIEKNVTWHQSRHIELPLSLNLNRLQRLVS